VEQTEEAVVNTPRLNITDDLLGDRGETGLTVAWNPIRCPNKTPG
jgi:hypothetical protein